MRRSKIRGRVLIDTSALLALANPRDQYHARAVASGRRFVAAGGRWIGSILVLAEFHVHVLRWRGPQAARAVVGQLLSDPMYEWKDVSVELLQASVTGWLERFGDQRFSLTDAVSFEIMRSERLTAAFAFDQDFRTAGFELIP